jgi:hypothetical protein
MFVGGRLADVGIFTNVRFAPETVAHPESLFLRSDNKRQKATRALHCIALGETVPLGPPEIPSRGA